MKKPKRLTLNKETLRDLTTQNAGRVKGGTATYNAWCTYDGCGPTYYYGCATNYNCATVGCTAYNCPSAGCHGKTYNKKCMR